MLIKKVKQYMISIDGQPLDVFSFPDGTKKIEIPFELLGYRDCNNCYHCTIDWRYESDEEFLQVAFVKKHLDNVGMNIETTLHMPYIPNARMDRVHSEDECFTLKHFADLINGLKFDHVVVFDPHSTVSEALLDRLVVKKPKEFILKSILDMIGSFGCNNDEIVLFFPDEGSQKRYLDAELKKWPAFFGNKIRDWGSGEILGLNIETHTDKGLGYLKGKDVLIIDDIISAGGTIYHSIKELEKHGVKSVFAYTSHLEDTMFEQTNIECGKWNTLLEMLVKGEMLKRIYTTDSLFDFSQNKRELVGDVNKIVVYNLVEEKDKLTDICGWV